MISYRLRVTTSVDISNFVSIQQQHGIAVEGGSSMPLITGYEQVIANRVTDLFAVVAQQDGEVVALSNKVIAVLYKDGTKKYYEIGRRFGKHQGGIIPHTVVTNLSVGQKFKVGDVISYNSDFFEINYLNPQNLLWKNGLLMNVAIMDTTDTFEDSSAISEKAAESLRTKMTSVRSLVIDFNVTVNDLVEVGDELTAESILCIMEDSITADNDLFDEETLSTLSQLSSASPRAKSSGKVEHIEVFYNGEIEEMSESLESIAITYDRQLSKVQKALGTTVVSGRVDENYRIEGKPLGKNQIVINIYITAFVAAGVGDKCVYANQMKSVIGDVLVGANKTESGINIDGIFGYQSISNRIVLSPEIIGTTNMLLEVIGKNAAKLYFGE